MAKKSEKPNLVVAGLLDYLSETGETKILPEVAQELENLLKESQRAEVITVSSYMPLSDEQMQKLKEIIKKLIKIDLPIVNRTDENLLGGFTIKVGDWFLDASISAQMNYLKKALVS